MSWYSSSDDSDSSSDGSDDEHGEHEQEEQHHLDSGSSDDDDDVEVSSAVEPEPPSKKLKAFDIAENDRISTLPDPVLVHILSFRNIREVIRTSQISRRWRPLWKSVPSLRFSPSKKRGYRGGDPTTTFVDRVLLHRNQDANMDKLSFSLLRLYDNDLESWITAAQRMGVQQLDLNLKYRNIDELPSFIFSSAIKVFKFRSAQSRMRVPKSMCVAAQLRSIELHNVCLPREDGNLRNKVTISCPVLEDLKMIDCDHKTIKTLRVYAPQLQRLVLDNPNPSKGAGNCKIRISTPNLTSLALRGIMYKNCTLKNLVSLAVAEFELGEHPTQAHILDNILKGLYNVTSLSLMLCLKTSPEFITMLFPNSFVNLRCLRLIGSSDGFGVRPIHFLTRTPCIETLILDINHVRNMDKDCSDMLKCLDGLKNCEIQGIECRANELDFCKFVLENASVLEAFTVTRHERFSLKTRKERSAFNMKIHSLPRASPKVDIYFS